MPLIWNIERILLELIRFNNCIILFPLQFVRRSRIGIHISNSMSLHFLVECSVSNSCCALLTLRFNLLLQWLGIFSPSLSCLCNRWSSLICFDELPCSEFASLHSAPSVSSSLWVYYGTGMWLFFLLGTWSDMDVTCQSRAKKNQKENRGDVSRPSLIMHASSWLCHGSFFFIILPPKRFISFNQYKMTKPEKLGSF